MASHNALKATLFAGFLMLAHTSNRAFFIFDFDDFDDYFAQVNKRTEQLLRDDFDSGMQRKSVSEESIALPEVTVERSKDGKHVTLTVNDLKDVKASDIKTTYYTDNRVIVKFPYRKGHALLKISPIGYGIAAEREITHTSEKKDAAGTVIGSSSRIYSGHNSRSESFGFKIDTASIKKLDYQPKLEGEKLVMTFDLASVGERIEVKAVEIALRDDKKKSDVKDIKDIVEDKKEDKKSEEEELGEK